jgi:hypothetical protein
MQCQKKVLTVSPKVLSMPSGAQFVCGSEVSEVLIQKMYCKELRLALSVDPEDRSTTYCWSGKKVLTLYCKACSLSKAPRM